MKRFIYFLFFVLLICTINTSCLKKKDFPVEPHIDFKSFDTFESTLHVTNWHGGDSTYNRVDSMHCIIKFTDGDGDIGIPDGDNTSKDDFVMTYLAKDANGNFVPHNNNLNGNPWDTLFVTYRIPDITPKGQYKSLEGEIMARFRLAPFAAAGDKVIKYEITIQDRAGHLSNKVTTNEIALP